MTRIYPHLLFLLCVLIKGTDLLTLNSPDTRPSKPSVTKAYYGGDRSRNSSPEGGWITFYCRADTTTSHLNWSSLYLNGVKIAQKNESGSEVEFTSYRASFRDAGSYTCTFTNSLGESTHSNAIQLTVYSVIPGAPEVVIGRRGRFHDPINETSLVKGTTTSEVYCDTGDLNGQGENCMLYINNQRFAFERYCGPFTISHTESGEFTCTQSSSTDTGPRGPVKIITFLDRPVIHSATSDGPKLSQPYTLTCNTSSTNITMSWYIGPEHNKTLLDYADSDTLQFDALAPMNEQVYYCKIVQGINEAWSKPFPLYFSKPAKPSLTRTEVEDAKDRNSTELQCLSDVTGTYHLYKDGFEIASKFGINQSFVVFSSETTDGSKYTCTVSSEVAESEHSNVQFINSKDLQLIASRNKTEIGESLTLTCVSKSNPQGTAYSWKIFRADGTVSRPQQGQTLTLNPVTEADEGIYSCEAEVDGVAMTSLVPLYNYNVVFDPPSPPAMLEVGFVHGGYSSTYEPHFQDLGLQDFDYDDDDHHYYVISCVCNDFLCDPKYGFRLYKNNKEVTFVRHTDVVRFTETSWNITRFYAIDITKSANDGTYTCTALNAVGESGPSNSIIISTSRVLPSPTLTADNPGAMIGQEITLTCNVPPMIPDFDITWKHWFSPILQSGRKLHLRNLRAADGGIYSCGYARPGSGNEFYKYDTNIETDSSNFFHFLLTAPQPPKFLRYIYLKDDKDDSGEYYIYGYKERIMIMCYEPYAFTEDIKYGFYLNGKRIRVSSVSSFTLPELGIGVYNLTCTAISSKTGESEMTYPSVLRVEARPTITPSINTTAIDRGVTVTLTCNVGHASNGHDIVWRKNDKVLAETSIQLTLTNVSDCDRGVYQCRQIVGIWHQALSEEFHLQFGKVEKPEILTYDGMDEKMSTLLNPGSSLTLYCVTANLVPILPLNSSKAVFYRDGKEIGSTFYNFPADVDDTLCKFRLSHTIRSLCNRDSGKYTCVMKSSLGVSEESDALTITVGGDCPSPPSGNGGGNAAVPVHANTHIIALQSVLAMVAVVSLWRWT